MRARLSLLLLLAAAPAQAASTPPGYVLSGMPLIRQSYNACGPASLTQVLRYYGVNADMATVSSFTRPSETSYMTAQAIVDFAPRVGMEARLYAGGSLNTVRAAIKNGVPVIALQTYVSPRGQAIPHWRVVAGYNDAARQTYLMDPLLGYVAMGYDDFSRVWADHHGQFALLYPPRLSATVKRVIG
ncbi:peptidase C39 [Deinococcus radiopugnans]|uniref:Peptidase C39 n=1 Tax=Deinococcus radiopugnans TaxID=57497 RepID=A0A0A7KIK7_9DEIO|nr:C39 family peptidase [Deinococcus radiopugnans]AIZ44358.1 peptidase C39 [Deinococcus radiopugnans]